MGQYKYTVYVDDNFHYMDESERYKLGEFDDCAAAIAACKQIVDESLLSNFGKCEDPHATYLMFGDDPFILTDDPNCKFSARDYARERMRVLAEGKCQGATLDLSREAREISVDQGTLSRWWNIVKRFLLDK